MGVTPEGQVNALIVHGGLSSTLMFIPPTVAAVRDIVGGDPEIVRPSTRDHGNWVAHTNREAAAPSLDFPVNALATHIAARCGWDTRQAFGRVLRGPVIFLGVPGEEEDVPLPLIEQAVEWQAHSAAWRAWRRAAQWLEGRRWWEHGPGVTMPISRERG